MKKEDKARIIEELTAVVKDYPHFYLVDTTGMNAEATSALRRKCFSENIKLVVVKNTLFQKALEKQDTDFSPLFDTLKGTTAVMFTDTANKPAKMLKDIKGGVPSLKAAFAEEGFYVGADYTLDLGQGLGVFDGGVNRALIAVVNHVRDLETHRDDTQHHKPDQQKLPALYEAAPGNGQRAHDKHYACQRHHQAEHPRRDDGEQIFFRVQYA